MKVEVGIRVNGKRERMGRVDELLENEKMLEDVLNVFGMIVVTFL